MLYYCTSGESRSPDQNRGDFGATDRRLVMRINLFEPGLQSQDLMKKRERTLAPEVILLFLQPLKSIKERCNGNESARPMETIIEGFEVSIVSFPLMPRGDEAFWRVLRPSSWVEDVQGRFCQIYHTLGATCLLSTWSFFQTTGYGGETERPKQWHRSWCDCFEMHTKNLQ
jgi:hypothetical protein